MSAHVYLIEAIESGRLKIGVAIDPDKRLRTLQCGSPEPLRLRYTIKRPSVAEAKRLEHALHKRFDLFHSHGEWFQARTVITDYFETGSANQWRRGAAR